MKKIITNIIAIVGLLSGSLEIYEFFKRFNFMKIADILDKPLIIYGIIFLICIIYIVIVKFKEFRKRQDENNINSINDLKKQTNEIFKNHALHIEYLNAILNESITNKKINNPSYNDVRNKIVEDDMKLLGYEKEDFKSGILSIYKLLSISQLKSKIE
jgi:hypothetical protein